MQLNAEPDTTIDLLDSFLCEELSAAETYRRALQGLRYFSLRSTLELCAASHRARARLLADEIKRRGGIPSERGGAWGALIAVDGATTMLGAKSAVAVLEAGEQREREEYERGAERLDLTARQLVEGEILPEQRRTYGAMRALYRALS